MSNNYPKSGISLEAQGADKFVQSLNAINVLYEKLTRQNESLTAQINRSALSMENQAAAHDLIAAKAKAAGAGVEYLNNAESVSAKAIAQVTALLKGQSDAQALVASASKQSAQPNIAKSTQDELDSAIRLARAKKDYKGAQELVNQAMQNAVGNQTRLNNLQIQSIAIQNAMARVARAVKDAVVDTYQSIKGKSANELMGLASQPVPSSWFVSTANAPKANQAPNLTDALGNNPIVIAEQAATAYDKFSNAVAKAITTVEASKKSDAEKKALTDSLTASIEAQMKAYWALLDAISKGDPAGIKKAQVDLGQTQASTAALLAQGKAAQGAGAANDKLGQHFTSVSSAIGASRVGVGLFTRELVQLAGGSSVAVQALDSFVYATGTLGIALGVVTAALILLRGASQQAAEEFDRHNAILARNTSSLKDYRKEYENLVKNDFFKLISLGWQSVGNATQFGGNIDKGIDKTVEGMTRATEGYKILGIAQKESIAIAHEEITTAVANRETRQQVFDRVVKLALATGTLTEETLKNADAYAQAVPMLDDYTNMFIRMGHAMQFVNDLAKINAFVSVAESEIGVQQDQAAAQATNAARSQLSSLQSLDDNYREQNTQRWQDYHARLKELRAQYNADWLQNEQEHNTRLDEINANLTENLTDAFSDFQQRVGDAENNAQETRNKNAQDFADRRAQIELDYQDRIAQIQSDYAASLFDIVAKDDAKGLVRARLQKEKALADAEEQREKDNQAAQKAQEKQEKALNDSLEKQKRQLQQDYDRRVRDLNQAAEKQLRSENTNYAKRQKELADNLKKQTDAEQANYDKQQAQADAAYVKQLNAAGKALAALLDLSDSYTQAIIGVLRQNLDPAIFEQIYDAFEAASQAKINIVITRQAPASYFPNPNPGQPGGTPFALGGVVPYTMQAMVHAKETVLPADDAERAYMLASQHMGRMNMPLGSHSRGGDGATGGIVRLYVDNSINSALLSSQIRVESIGVATEIVKRARG